MEVEREKSPTIGQASDGKFMGGTELDKEGREAMLGDERGKRGNRQLANRRNQNFLSGKPSGKKNFFRRSANHIYY